jgi:hypothetical protein
MPQSLFKVITSLKASGEKRQLQLRRRSELADKVYLLIDITSSYRLE